MVSNGLVETGVVRTRGAGNGRRSLALLGVALGLWAVCFWLMGDDGGADGGGSVVRVLLPVAVLVSTVALVWVTGEAHLRWSPARGPSRALVGWVLAVACLAVCLVVAFWGLLIWLYAVGA